MSVGRDAAEHWFDLLARPQSRCAALKMAVAAGAMLVLPASRTSRAQAAPGEPCFEPCIQAARTRWDRARDQCSGLSTQAIAQAWSRLYLLALNPAGVLAGLADRASQASCYSSAELMWHRDTLACRGSECGNPAKYPGGTEPPPPKPKPKCDPVQEILCGDICCYATVDCCMCSAGAKCCAAGKCDSCCRVT